MTCELLSTTTCTPVGPTLAIAVVAGVWYGLRSLIQRKGEV